MTIDTDNKTIQRRRLGRTEYQVTSLGLGTYRLTMISESRENSRWHFFLVPSPLVLIIWIPHHSTDAAKAKN